MIHAYLYRLFGVAAALPLPPIYPSMAGNRSASPRLWSFQRSYSLSASRRTSEPWVGKFATSLRQWAFSRWPRSDS